MFLDGKLVCQFQADYPSSGGVLVWGGNGEIHFDNVVITGDDIPDGDIGLPVSAQAKLAIMWEEIKRGP